MPVRFRGAAARRGRACEPEEPVGAAAEEGAPRAAAEPVRVRFVPEFDDDRVAVVADGPPVDPQVGLLDPGEPLRREGPLRREAGAALDDPDAVLAPVRAEGLGETLDPSGAVGAAPALTSEFSI